MFRTMLTVACVVLVVGWAVPAMAGDCLGCKKVEKAGQGFCAACDQGKIFGVTSQKGVVTHLAGEHGPEQAVIPSGMPDLDLAPAGTVPSNPAELLSSEEFGRFLEWAAERYDRVVIDSSPVLYVTDPAVLATQVDGVILVVRVGGRTTRSHVASAARTIVSVGGMIAGTVANAFGKRDAYSQYYYHDRYPYYGTASDGDAADASGQSLPGGADETTKDNADESVVAVGDGFGDDDVTGSEETGHGGGDDIGRGDDDVTGFDETDRDRFGDGPGGDETSGPDEMTDGEGEYAYAGDDSTDSAKR